MQKSTEQTRQQYDEIAFMLRANNVKHSKLGAFGNRKHITSTLSMGNDPRDSVTDAFGRAHDDPNLYMPVPA